ncbi:hypothetical protein BIWAKO_04590 [Bosea sp. BIWAKO-01]|nr:hypothetical protein BIWAKO_04590 [Bosea sp. BIWAKO-01]
MQVDRTDEQIRDLPGTVDLGGLVQKHAEVLRAFRQALDNLRR